MRIKIMRRLLKITSIFITMFGSLFLSYGQDSLFVLTPADVSDNGYLTPVNITEWEFKKGNDPAWKNSPRTDRSWTKLDSLEIANLDVDDDGKFEGWFRFQFKMEGAFKIPPFFLVSSNSAAQEIYLDGKFLGAFGTIGKNSSDFEMNLFEQSIFLPIRIGETHQIAIHFLDKHGFAALISNNSKILTSNSFLAFTDSETAKAKVLVFERGKYPVIIAFTLTSLILLVTLFINFLNRSEKNLRYIAYCILIIWCYVLTVIIFFFNSNPYIIPISRSINTLFLLCLFIILPVLSAQIFYNRIPKWVKIISIVTILFFIISSFKDELSILPPLIAVLSCFWIVYKSRKSISIPKWAIVVGVIGTPICLIITFIVGQLELLNFYDIGYFFVFSMSVFPVSLLAYIVLWLRDSVGNEKQKAAQVIALTEKNRTFLENQNIELEQKVSKRTKELNDSLEHLKSTQSQLIQSEKMASLGELTAGIAHEIQNPLNFVNNFSEVSNELIDEMNEELDNGDLEEAKAISVDIKQNLEKITHHGKRADSIVKGMLQHSRTSGDKKEPTNINALADEYLRLAYHGLRAKDKAFNSDMHTDLDEGIKTITIIPQDIGRVVLNLVTNAFYAVNEKSKAAKVSGDATYKPLVSIATKKKDNSIEITVTDNGNGMPDKVKEKIFQPFFTTKPTGKGTGLGLSMSYDIVTKGHGGQLSVTTEEGKRTEFTIQLPNSL